MTEKVLAARDDRVLAYTRGLSLFIVPFLLAAFVILYLFPGRSGELFAWPVKPSMTARVLASAYLGGAYFFLRVAWEKRWTSVKNGFPAVVVFASLLGLETVLHWDSFSHGHVSFWTWSALYFIAPFLVLGAWLSNRRYAAPPRPDEKSLVGASRLLVLGFAVGGTTSGLAMFVAPDVFIPWWPWALTPLTCRVVASVLCLAVAGLGVWPDGRSSTLERLTEVALIMTGLMLVASILGRSELVTDRPLFWPWVLGLVFLVAASTSQLLTRDPRGQR
jgi:hypothetical protein